MPYCPLSAAAVPHSRLRAEGHAQLGGGNASFLQQVVRRKPRFACLTSLSTHLLVIITRLLLSNNHSLSAHYLYSPRLAASMIPKLTISCAIAILAACISPCVTRQSSLVTHYSFCLLPVWLSGAACAGDGWSILVHAAMATAGQWFEAWQLLDQLPAEVCVQSDIICCCCSCCSCCSCF